MSTARSALDGLAAALYGVHTSAQRGERERWELVLAAAEQALLERLATPPAALRARLSALAEAQPARPRKDCSA